MSDLESVVAKLTRQAVKLVPSIPTADAGLRSALIYLVAAPGAADELLMCMKDTTNAYSFISLATADFATTVTSQHTVSSSDQFLLCDATGGSFAVYLPLASAWRNGRPINVKKTTAANTVTITATGGNLIDGAATLAMTASMTSYTLRSDGVSGWWIQ